MKQLLKSIAFSFIPYLKAYYQYSIANLVPMSYARYVYHRLFAHKPYWPIQKGCMVGNEELIYVGRNSNIGLSGNYIAGGGGVFIGNYVRVHKNVGIISRNHDLYNHKASHTKPIIIRDYCWLGMGCKVLAGVELGPRTIVAANAVVTKSFPQGYCVLAGVPAKVIKELEPEKVVKYRFKEETYGYLPPKAFDKYKKKHLRSCPFLDENGELKEEFQ